SVHLPPSTPADMSMPRRRSVATPLRSGTHRLTLREERPYATRQNAHAPRHRCAQPPDHGVGHAHGQEYASPLTSCTGDLAVTTEYQRPAATIAAGWEESDGNPIRRGGGPPGRRRRSRTRRTPAQRLGVAVDEGL